MGQSVTRVGEQRGPAESRAHRQEQCLEVAECRVGGGDGVP